MSGSSRAATASNSQRVKQRLVKILFGKEYSKQGREAHHRLDFSSYSYIDLRKAYIQKVQFLHPDKMHLHATTIETVTVADDNSLNTTSLNINSTIDNASWQDVEESIKRHQHKIKTNDNGHEAFVELQHAWDEYDQIAKTAMKSGGNNDSRVVQEDFTMFGVGCSFSDNPAEQKRRAEIMDQASRGWFAAGQIDEGAKLEVVDDLTTSTVWSTDFDGADCMHVNMKIDAREEGEGEERNQSGSQQTKENESRRRTLIDHMMPKRR